MMQPPRQPRSRQQFAAQLLTLVLTDRPAIGADTGRGRGGALIIRVIRILLPTEAFLVSCHVVFDYLLCSESYHFCPDISTHLDNPLFI